MIDEAMQQNVRDRLEPQKAQRENAGRANQQVQQSQASPRAQSDRGGAPGQAECHSSEGEEGRFGR
jgi:hypothetical protein